MTYFYDSVLTGVVAPTIGLLITDNFDEFSQTLHVLAVNAAIYRYIYTRACTVYFNTYIEPVTVVAYLILPN